MKTPTTIHQAMMEDIIASPSDLSLRLMYADMLEDEGQEGYAYFIRAGIRNDTAEMDTQLDEFHFRMWFGPVLNDNISFLKWRRQPQGLWVRLSDSNTAANFGDDCGIFIRNGFIEEVECRLQYFHNHGPRLCQHQPVVSVKITDRTPEQNFPGYYYWSSSHNAQHLMENNQSPHFIPDQMMGMKHKKPSTATSDNRLIGDTVELVNVELSSRLIIWARSQPLTD